MFNIFHRAVNISDEEAQNLIRQLVDIPVKVCRGSIREPLHRPLHLFTLILAPETCSYRSKVLKVSSIETSSTRKSVVSSEYWVIFTIDLGYDRPLMFMLERI